MAELRQAGTAMAAAGVVALVAASFLVGSGGSGGAPAKADATTPDQNVVTVQGTGKASGTPDTMVTTVSVNTRGASPSVALDAASRTMARVQRTLAAHGVAAKDLQTTGLQVNPVWVYTKGKQSTHGYSAEEDLSVTLRDLHTAGTTISAAIAVGGSTVTVGGLTLDLEGDSTLVTNARAAAFADAKTKAQQYAALAGRTLGSVLSVTEASDASSPTPEATYAAAASTFAAVPVAAGSAGVDVSVTVVWSLS